MDIKIVAANFDDEQHGQSVVYLLNEYALDPMGGGKPLTNDVKENLAKTMSKLPNVFSVLCFIDGEPAGLINCVEGFSTFACMPLVNIHDVIVAKKFRRLGLTDKMLAKVEQMAQERGACKLTLEVLEGNNVAQNAYIKAGFDSYELDPAMGKAMFWQKTLG
ncbi:GNAT family N-acetyltransferase [Thalassotalea atypica]|uniref:GNAT family N-acetyltransferase n=1 Tax=Thalassotalea atypica TaxID=2054316 RepID=UPI0025747F05|nr:GNAT family N-acetyltransferase [Thalassotalea atypica]